MADWKWQKARRCDKVEMEENALFQYLDQHYYRVKAVPRYVMYLDQYYGTHWHILDEDLNEVCTRRTKVECVWWINAHK